MYCQYCGEKLVDEAIYCSSCGAKIHNAVSSNSPDEQAEPTAPIQTDANPAISTLSARTPASGDQRSAAKTSPRKKKSDIVWYLVVIALVLIVPVIYFTSTAGDRDIQKFMEALCVHDNRQFSLMIADGCEGEINMEMQFHSLYSVWFDKPDITWHKRDSYTLNDDEKRKIAYTYLTEYDSRHVAAVKGYILEVAVNDEIYEWECIIALISGDWQIVSVDIDRIGSFAAHVAQQPTAPQVKPAATEATPEAQPEFKPAQQVNLTMVTGGTSGTYYAYGGVIANVLTEALDNVTITASTSGASVANARSINSKDADLAILQSDVLDYAHRGVLMFGEEGALTNVATIGALYPEIIQIVATEASGIKSVADLAGKRVSIGDFGSSTEASATQILEAYGMTVNDLGKCEHMGFYDSSAAIQNMTLDAAFVTAGVPSPVIIDLNATVDVNLIPIAADKAAALITKYPFYTNHSIADSDYEGIAGVDTVTVLATLACSKDLDADVVYTITKALFENQPKLAESHAKGAMLSAQSALSGVSVPLHPGAKKYYREIILK